MRLWDIMKCSIGIYPNQRFENCRTAITKMYRDIAEIIGIEDYDIVNPYNNKLTKSYDLLIISKGYRERVEKLNPYPIFEIKSATFDNLINSMNELKKLNIGVSNLRSKFYDCKNFPKENFEDFTKINSYIENINKKKNQIKSIKYNKDIKINTKSEFIKKIIIDLGLTLSNDGITVIPDYMVNKGDINDGIIIINTHNYDLNTLERIENRYLQIINSINSL